MRKLIGRYPLATAIAVPVIVFGAMMIDTYCTETLTRDRLRMMWNLSPEPKRTIVITVDPDSGKVRSWK